MEEIWAGRLVQLICTYNAASSFCYPSWSLKLFLWGQAALKLFICFRLWHIWGLMSDVNLLCMSMLIKQWVSSYPK